MIEIVCYNGGACGDLVTAMIDPQEAVVNNTLRLAPDRSLLKKTHLFAGDQERNQYLVRASQHWNSIPSHDLEYHVRQAHDFIAITVEDWDTALWAATRFQQLHRPHVWQEMVESCGANNVKGYAQVMRDFSSLIKTKTQRIIQLERIVTGHAVEDLLQLVPAVDANIYHTWLQQQTGLTK
jgi:hypothetical protein